MDELKFTLVINQKQALDLGITNVNQAHILDLLMSCSTWASSEVIDDQVYFWVARQRICDELPILNIKPDTAWRHLKKLDELGLIDYQKKGKKDCLRLTEKGKSYYIGNKSEFPDSPMSEIDSNHYVGNESENPMSEMNPNELGNKSDILNNHTYQTNKGNQAQFPNGLNIEAWSKWNGYRRACKLSKYKTSGPAEDLATLPFDLQMECVNLSIKKEWKSLVTERFINAKTSNNGKNRDAELGELLKRRQDEADAEAAAEAAGAVCDEDFSQTTGAIPSAVVGISGGARR